MNQTENNVTIFEKILAKKIPANIVYEDDFCLAFKDIQPQAPVHVLVIPKKKMQSFVEVAEQDVNFLGRYMQGISKAAKALELDSSGYRVVFNSGKDAQQTVDYIHAHILGKRSLDWPPG